MTKWIYEFEIEINDEEMEYLGVSDEENEIEKEIRLSLQNLNYIKEVNFISAVTEEKLIELIKF